MNIGAAEIRISGPGGDGLPGCILALTVYIYCATCLYTIGKKVGVDSPWLAFVPILQAITLVQASGRSALWLLGIFIPGLNLAVAAWYGMGLAEQRGHPEWVGVLLAIPFLNFLALGYLAFRDPPGRPAPAVVPPAPEAPPAERLLDLSKPTERCAQCGTPYSLRSDWWCSAGFCSERCYRRAEQADDRTAIDD